MWRPRPNALPAVGVVLICSFGLRPAAAQETKHAPTDGVLEQITVTAQRRAENLQSVPVAVTALTEEALINAGVSGTQDLQMVAPGIIWTTGRNSAVPYLRGVGSTQNSSGNEGLVALYVDGVYYPSMDTSTLNLVNVERVEVLRGPQGTLFGRNATGGLINVITKTPSRDPSADVTLGYGNFDTVTATAYGTTGITDTLAADLSVQYVDQGEGWGRNLTTGDEIHLADVITARTKWLLEASDNTRFTLAADLAQRDSDIGSTRFIIPGALGLDGVSRYTGSGYDTLSEVRPEGFSDQWGASLRAEHDMQAVHLMSLTSYREADSHFRFDQEATPAPIVVAPSPRSETSFTQEFQISSADASPFQWIGGLFYMDRDAGNEPLTIIIGGNAQNRFVVQNTRSISAFAQTTFKLGSLTNLTTGLRYTEDKQEIDGFRTDAAGVVNLRSSNEGTFDKLTWRFAIDHHFLDSLMAYASANRGFKSGYFNTTDVAPPLTRPETLDAYEVGFKWDLLNDRLRLNGLAFYYDYQDLQLEVVQTGATVGINAPSAEVTGFEFEMVAVPTEHLTFNAALSILSAAKYVDFTSAPFFVPRATGGNAQVVSNADDNRMVHTPDWTLNAGADWRIPSAYGEFGVNLAYYYNDGFFWDFENNIAEGSYEKINATLSWTSPGESLTLSLWGNNLTDELSTTTSVSTTGNIAQPAPPRTYGFTVRMRF